MDIQERFDAARDLAKAADRIAELERFIDSGHLVSFDVETYINGLRHEPGDYVMIRVGPVIKSEPLF